MAGEFAEIIPGMILVALEEKIQRQQITQMHIYLIISIFLQAQVPEDFTVILLCPDDEEPTKQKYNR